MSSPTPHPIDPLHAVLVRALADLLDAAGFPGGVLLAITPDGSLLVVSALDPDFPMGPAALLRLGVESLEGGADVVGEGTPTNG